MLEQQEAHADEFGSGQLIVTAGADMDGDEDDHIEEDIVVCGDDPAIMGEVPIEEDISASAQTNQILPQGILSTEQTLSV